MAVDLNYVVNLWDIAVRWLHHGRLEALARWVACSKSGALLQSMAESLLSIGVQRHCVIFELNKWDASLVARLMLLRCPKLKRMAKGPLQVVLSLTAHRF
jgi:hypothetical protein